MFTITTKRHPFKFYFSIFLGSLFFIFIAAVMAVLAFKLPRNGAGTKIVLLLMSACCLFVAFYTLIRYFKNAPRIIIDRTGIIFNKELFLWKDLDEIELSGKQPFPYFINFPMEGVFLRFKNGQVKYIFDMYTNTSSIKSFIREIVVNKKQFMEAPLLPVTKNEFVSEQFSRFKGNALTSFRGILIWIVPVFFLALFYVRANGVLSRAGLIVIIIFSVGNFLFNSVLMNYFTLSQNLFCVRNHNFFWKNKAYRVKDIYEIVFETQGKMPNCLRVITKDFSDKLYPAATLRTTNWLDLKDKLEAKGVKVRNECIS